MKINRQSILFFILLGVAVVSFLLFPNFEREDFDPNKIESISSGSISSSTSTTIIENNQTQESSGENNIPNETFESSIYDTLLTNNSTNNIDNFFTTYLVIGSDERSLNSSESRGFVEGSRADVIMLVLIDQNSIPTLVSIPRDLLIKDPCTQKIQRINSSYISNECGSSAENLSAALLNITGLGVDHFVKFSFEGFEKIIDSFGGINICVNETQREGYSFEIQKGCNLLSGDIALNWVVSRNTEVLDGEKLVDENGSDISNWKPMKGVSDLTRIQKQQKVVIEVMKNINDFDSLNSFFKFVNALEDTFIIDNNISLIQASELVWSFRNLEFDSLVRLTVPTFNYITEDMAQVLILEDSFYNFLKSNELLK